MLGAVQGDSNPAQFIPRLIELHRAGRLPFDRLIHRYPFEKINEAASATIAGTTIKPVLIRRIGPLPVGGRTRRNA
jgi:aryl-alcohol dehydrogenase